MDELGEARNQMAKVRTARESSWNVHLQKSCVVMSFDHQRKLNLRTHSKFLKSDALMNAPY